MVEVAVSQDVGLLQEDSIIDTFHLQIVHHEGLGNLNIVTDYLKVPDTIAFDCPWDLVGKGYLCIGLKSYILVEGSGKSSEQKGTRHEHEESECNRSILLSGLRELDCYCEFVIFI